MSYVDPVAAIVHSGLTFIDKLRSTTRALKKGRGRTWRLTNETPDTISTLPKEFLSLSLNFLSSLAIFPLINF